LRRKKILFNAPRYVQALIGYIEDWKPTSRGMILYLKDEKIKEVLIQYRRLSMCFDVKTQLSCSVNIVSKIEMDKEKIELFRQLKEMECELNWINKSIFFREPRFVSPPYLNLLRDRIPGFKINDSLRRYLSQDKNLMKLICAIKPDDLIIKLICFNPEVRPTEAFDNLSEALLDSIIEFYRNPAEITWVISVAKLLSLAQGKHLRGMIDILRILSDKIDSFTRRAKL